MQPYPLFFKPSIVSTGLVCLLLGMGSLTHAQTDSSAYVPWTTFPNDGSAIKAGGSYGHGVSYGVLSDPNTIKVYIPPGTVRFNLFGSLPQGVSYAVISRLGTPPATAPVLTSDDLFRINSTYDTNVAFNKLLAGEEVIHPATFGTIISFSGNGNLYRWPTLKGVWLYAKVLIAGDALFGFQSNSIVDVDTYNSLKSSIVYKNNSDPYPVEDLKPPVKPTGIAVPTVEPGKSVSIQPVPSDAIVIGECTIDPNSQYAINQLITVTNYTLTVSPNAPVGTVGVRCGDATDTTAQYAATTPRFTTTLTIGTTVPLEGLSLSANYINVTSPTPITINPVPSNASISSCSLSGAGAGLATVSGSTITLNAGVASGVTAPISTTVTCSGKAANFTMQPPPSLALTPSTLSQASNTSVTIGKSDGTFASSCQFSSTSSWFDPNVYLDWISSTIKFKTAAPTLTQKQTVSVTCDGSQSATLTLDPAPVGRLYPEKDSTDPRKMLLRWQEADASGKVTLYSLAGKYPSYPTGSNTKFVCSEIDAQDKAKAPSNFSFTAATGTTEPYLTLTTTPSTPLKTKIRCFVMTTTVPSAEVAGSTKDLPLINITNNSWYIAQPTATNPIIDDSDAKTAKFQLYVPRATLSPTTNDVPVVIMGYIPSGNQFAGTEAMFTSSGLKIWNGTQTDTELMYTTVSGSADRVISVDLGFPKSALAGLKVKVAVFYRDGWWKSLTTPETEWDSTK